MSSSTIDVEWGMEDESVSKLGVFIFGFASLSGFKIEGGVIPWRTRVVVLSEMPFKFTTPSQ
jgi:hypothetical protein